MALVGSIIVCLRNASLASLTNIEVVFVVRLVVALSTI